MHPLDPNRDLNSQGRVRVQFRNDDGSLFNEKFPTSIFFAFYECFHIVIICIKFLSINHLLCKLLI